MVNKNVGFVTMELLVGWLFVVGAARGELPCSN